MRTHLWIFLIVLFLGFSTAAQEAQKPASTAATAEFKIPAEAAKRTNPVKPDETSIAAGKKRFGYDCAMCHGEKGDGHGELATSAKLKVPDYRDPATLGNRTDGELFYIIQHGKGDMPEEGDRAKPGDIWNLVNYVRHLAKEGTSAKEKPSTP
jgi:mono/diheme cytochrome c family protein